MAVKYKTHIARKLRKNASQVEVKFWYAINRNQLNVKFRRQHPIGKYFVDFICLEKKLIIELDGETHASVKAINYDNERTDFLEKAGYRVIRIPNGNVVTNLESVVLHLKLILDGKVEVNSYFKSKNFPPTPAPPLEGGRV